MPIDWGTIRDVAGPIFGFFVGLWGERWFGERPRLVANYGHVSSFTVRTTDQPPSIVNTHAVEIRNWGRKPALNVRLAHGVFPDNFRVFPEVEYSVVSLPDGGREIVIPMLRAREQVTISYLYFPPLTFDQINGAVRSDDGFAKIVKLGPISPIPTWVTRTIVLLAVVGAVAIVYGIARALK